MKALLIESALDLGAGLALRLRREGHVVDWVIGSAIAINCFRENYYDVIILNLTLDDASGTELIVWLRRRRISTPVLAIGTHREVETKVEALDVGADDYLVMPFDIRELEARLRAITRKYGEMRASKGEVGNIVMDCSARSIVVEGSQILLTRREYRLFELLISRLGQVIPKERLMQQIFSGEEDVGPNALELYVSRLRRKLRSSTLRIDTVRHVGYAARINDTQA